MKAKSFTCFFLLLVIYSYTNAARKYVCTCGNDGNTGNSPAAGQAYLTIQHAIDATPDYDTLFVVPGVFTQSTSITITRPITIKKYNVAGEAIIDASTLVFSPVNPFVIAIVNTKDVTIDSLKIRNAIYNEAKGIWVLRNSDAGAKMRNVTISNCTITNIGWISNDLDSSQYNSSIATNAIKVEGQTATSISSVLIKNNRITNCATGWGEAVTITGNVDTFYIQNNIVDSIANIGIVAAGNYTSTGAPANVNQARNGIISGNSVSNCMSGNAVSAGIYLDGSRNCVVEKNKCFRNALGISVGAEEAQGANFIIGHIVQNNLIYKNSIAGMFLGSSTPGNKVINSYIVNNTFFKNVTADTINGIDSIGLVGSRESLEQIANGSAGEVLLFNCDKDTFQNNIIYTLVNTVGRKAIVGMSNGTETDFGINYNLYYHEDATPLFFFASGNSFNGISGPQTYTTIPNFYAAPARQDSNSVFANPSFVDTTLSNFQLRPCSYAIDKGNPLYNTLIHGAKDYIDSTRVFDNVRIDCGAYEYSACFIAALAGIPGATQVCVSNTVLNAATDYFDAGCNFISKVIPSGASPVSGNVTSCVIIDGAVQTFNAAPYVQRHYDIEPAVNPNTATATVTLYFTNQEFVNYNLVRGGFPALPTLLGGGNSDANRAKLRITQYHGVPVAPHNIGNPAPGFYSLNTSTLIIPDTVKYNNTCGYWEVTCKVAGFSGFYVHTSNFNVTLPVNINYFTGYKQGSSHLLNWKVTCNSSPGTTMVLQRSADSRIFNDLNSITADAARCQQPFNYIDTYPLKGINYYRLKMTDADGKVTYSEMVALLNAVKGFDIISIAPNPVVNDNFKLNIASAKAGKIDMAILDVQGRLVNRQSISVIAGFNSLPVNVSNFASGTYTMRVGITDEQFKIIRFVKGNN
jgi:Secretion system C-terminal sorting domain